MIINGDTFRQLRIDRSIGMAKNKTTRSRERDPVEQIKEATARKGVDVALELIGSAKTMRQGRTLPRPSRTLLSD